ncbi:RNA polymerase sigma-70 factor, ECF subfamily [Parabacteroides chinchillae]|uniref:RNA polymerase sigma-70 factor, ECF subfamily n=6 Tax=Parabacteroides TaxID=375288 RepID=A0A8G2BTU7_9BACT|nr:RNA polymerase sigma-70 factor, ECF subfamily [Parabacteroides chinchillae]
MDIYFKYYIYICTSFNSERIILFRYLTFNYKLSMNALQFQKKLLSMQENMMNFALMLTANRDDAQDLMQDTTLKVLDNQEKFVDNINFKGWVLTVMRNIFINNYHKIVRTQTVVDQGVDLYNLDVVNDSGFDTPDGAYQIQEITKAINSLNNELKIPFSMFLSGYKYNEIADKLNVPLGTVKSRIFFARQELQKILKDFRHG